jgi:hypothetical protein
VPVELHRRIGCIRAEYEPQSRRENGGIWRRGEGRGALDRAYQGLLPTAIVGALLEIDGLNISYSILNDRNATGKRIMSRKSARLGPGIVRCAR